VHFAVRDDGEVGMLGDQPSLQRRQLTRRQITHIERVNNVDGVIN
jgi:hypothetical protein